MLAKYDGKIKPKLEVAYGFGWKPLKEVKNDPKKNPDSYAIWVQKLFPK